MRGPVRDTAAMIAGMAPVLSDGRYVFAETGDPALLARAFAVVREAEGTTAVLPVEVADGAGLDTSLPMACITLSVHSALDGVGLTAAVAQALAGAEIPCNVQNEQILIPRMDQGRRPPASLGRSFGSAPCPLEAPAPA
ncbi:ACT domain-containing protein [Rhodosalinus sediminis]|uniref:ACT domain-containing protein n=1 Tax=Rhodosalinus sediminis TaxID=1940533 RepID=UPI003B5C6EA5